MHVLESPLHADFAFIKAERGDRWGNLNYRKTARNFGPVMAMAARTTVATVHEVVPLGALDTESIVTPGIFVQRVVPVPRTVTAAGGFKRSEEHTSELQSLMCISYAVFCLQTIMFIMPLSFRI